MRNKKPLYLGKKRIENIVKLYVSSEEEVEKFTKQFLFDHRTNIRNNSLDSMRFFMIETIALSTLELSQLQKERLQSIKRMNATMYFETLKTLIYEKCSLNK